MATPKLDGGCDYFPGELKTKAVEIERLAELSHAAELAVDGDQGGAGRAFFSWVPEAFSKFSSLPHPREFDPLMDAMAAVLRVFGQPGVENGYLQPAAGGPDFVGALAHMASWQGEAKRAFVNLGKRWEPMSGNQAMVAVALREALCAQKVLADTARKDVLRIADHTVAVLEAGSCDWGDVKVALSLVSAVSSAAAAMAPGAAVALTVVSAGAGFGADAIGGEKKELPLSGPTVPCVMRNMADALVEVSRQLESSESEIVKALDHNVDVVTGQDRPFYVAPQLDEITDVTVRNATARMEPS